ncbi:putative aldo keto reductase [Mycena venus]|uniref:Putative aldo keto reductase n=1 Tax=Mycena venus TaxID=2733690 RepID=A0A8H6XM82_9AGAR|nr:putative aldo keto reductase [Mycena venus]
MSFKSMGTAKLTLRACMQLEQAKRCSFLIALSQSTEGSIGFEKRGLKVATKIFPTRGKKMWWLTADDLTHAPEDLRKGLNLSLAALKTNKLDIYYLHVPDRNVPYEDTLREINKMHTEGLFARFGLSNFPAWEVAQICEICKRNGWVMPTVYQGLYNAQHRVVEAELVPLYVYNPLAGGFLTSRYTRDQREFEFSDRYNPERAHAQHQRARFWSEANFAALDLLRAAVAAHGITESEAALRWLAHHSAIKKEFGDAVIVGAAGKKHLEENLEALDKGPLSADIVAALDAGWEQARTRPLTLLPASLHRIHTFLIAPPHCGSTTRCVHRGRLALVYAHTSPQVMSAVIETYVSRFKPRASVPRTISPPSPLRHRPPPTFQQRRNKNRNHKERTHPNAPKRHDHRCRLYFFTFAIVHPNLV